jgi:hypothetical protein
MDDPNNTDSSGALDQTNEDILTDTASDEALEAAGGHMKLTKPYTLATFFVGGIFCDGCPG